MKKIPIKNSHATVPLTHTLLLAKCSKQSQVLLLEKISVSHHTTDLFHYITTLKILCITCFKKKLFLSHVLKLEVSSEPSLGKMSSKGDGSIYLLVDRSTKLF
jgi:hypothetical protein